MRKRVTKKSLLKENGRNAVYYQIKIYGDDFITQKFNSQEELLKYIEDNYVVLYKNNDEIVSNICINMKEITNIIQSESKYQTKLFFGNVFKFIFINKNILKLINKKLSHIHVNDATQINLVKNIVKIITNIEYISDKINRSIEYMRDERFSIMEFELLNIDENARINGFVKNWDEIKEHFIYYTNYYVDSLMESIANIKIMREKYENIIENNEFKTLFYSLIFEKNINCAKELMYIYDYEKAINDFCKLILRYIFNRVTSLSLSEQEIKERLGKENYENIFKDVNKIVLDIVNTKCKQKMLKWR